MTEALDRAEAGAGPIALVTTGEASSTPTGLTSAGWPARAAKAVQLAAGLAGQDKRTLTAPKRLVYGEVMAACGVPAGPVGRREPAPRR